MSECGVPCPEDPEVRCDKSAPCLGYHANAPAQKVWPGTPLPPPVPPRSRNQSAKARLALIASRCR